MAPQIWTAGALAGIVACYRADRWMLATPYAGEGAGGPYWIAASPMTRQTLLPPGWPRPKGYSNGIAASGRFVFTAGVVGWNEQEAFAHKDLAGQFRQALLNVRAILAEGGAAPADIVRVTCYVTDKHDYIASRADIGEAWRKVFGKVFPCMAVVEVSALVEDDARVELEVTAIVAEPAP